ncbi:MAG: alanine racemase, partial [Thermomicrobiales bacterium]|nr:alanine racemase [Thermomicrobiales bacterium]
FGILPNRAVDVARTIDIDPYLRLQGIYSHLAEADEENPARMNAQIELFRQAHATISEAGVDPGIAHISNSAALLRTRSSDFGMVRAGICLYGISPSRHVALFRGMKPALEWRATVQHLISMEPGDRTGYGGTYVASDNERLALIPIGYADGYPRQLSNIGWMGFDGQRLQVRGRISMDQCTIAIPGQIDLKVGDDVTVLGGAGNGAPSANELGDVLGTIGYEIVSRISPRVPVEYV